MPFKYFEDGNHMFHTKC